MGLEVTHQLFQWSGHPGDQYTGGKDLYAQVLTRYNPQVLPDRRGAIPHVSFGHYAGAYDSYPAQFYQSAIGRQNLNPRV